MGAAKEKRRVVALGTQVVKRVQSAAGAREAAGTVGVIIGKPMEMAGLYRVRFPDGTEEALRGSDFHVRKDLAKSIASTEGESQQDLYQFVIYRCVVGSRAYGLDEQDSDVDRRGIYLAPADLGWSLQGVPEQLEIQETQECYWELEKLLRLALRANPNVLECLYTPMVEEATPLAEELLGMRGLFVTRMVYQTYNGYVLSQLKKLGQDQRNKGQIRWKHAMHLVRLLISGIEILKTGVVPVKVAEHRDKLLAIRRGEVAWREVDGWRKELHREFDRAWADTKLPEYPDYERVNRFLVEARRSRV